MTIRNDKVRVAKSKTYQIWQGVKYRCLNANSPSFARYGGRGITICDRWLNGENDVHPFLCFLQDMGERPDGTWLERINNDANYEPSNCVWATPKEQGNNKSDNRRVMFQGQSYTLAQLAEKAGVKPRTLHARIQELGWSVEKAATRGVSPRTSQPKISLTIAVSPVLLARIKEIAERENRPSLSNTVEYLIRTHPQIQAMQVKEAVHA